MEGGNLKGVIVLAFQALPPLQFTCHMLEQQGATVITVMNQKQSSLNLTQDYFKDSKSPSNTIALDLKSDSDRAKLITQIVPHVHVLLESYRPGVMEKLNLSPKEIHSINPSIIYGRLSGFGQVESKYKERAGHDINYLALTGVLSKFRRVDKGEPAAPANFLADFASGSLHLFNQVLQALYLKTPNTVIDCSLAHSTMYLSQLELLKEITYGPINRHKSKLNVPKPSFTHPHEMIFTDFDGNLFTPLPGTKFHEKIMIQHFNDEEGESAQKYGEIMQLAFVGMKIEQIEKEYGPMNRIAKYDDVIEKRYSNGNIPNVFDQEYKVREPKQGAAQELIGKL